LLRSKLAKRREINDFWAENAVKTVIKELTNVQGEFTSMTSESPSQKLGSHDLGNAVGGSFAVTILITSSSTLEPWAVLTFQ
jgi:hypothetical protein